MIAAMHGVQAPVFIMRRKRDMTPQELMEGVVNALLTIRQSLTTKW